MPTGLSMVFFLPYLTIPAKLKSGFISKFNQINASVYEDYGRILRKDVINAFKNKANLDHTYAISRRVGLSQIPLGCVFLRYLSLAMSSPAPQAYFAKHSSYEVLLTFLFGFGVLLLFKISIGIALLLYSLWSYDTGEISPEASRKRLERSIWMDRLSNIERFTVWKGKIVG